MFRNRLIFNGNNARRNQHHNLLFSRQRNDSKPPIRSCLHPSFTRLNLEQTPHKMDLEDCCADDHHYLRHRPRLNIVVIVWYQVEISTFRSSYVVLVLQHFVYVSFHRHNWSLWKQIINQNLYTKQFVQYA